MLLLDIADKIQDRFPALARWLRRVFVERSIPFHRTIGLKVQENSHGIYRLRLPFSKSNQNITGTVNGAAIMCIGEAIHGLFFYHNFKPTEFALVTRNIEVAYLRPGMSDLFSEFRFGDDDRNKLLNQISTGSRTKVNFPSEVRDDQGKLVAKFDVEYVVIRSR